MTKNFEGSIYLNYYIDGATGLIGMLIAQPLYSCFKIRWSFVFGLSFTIIFSFLLMGYQEEYFDSSFTESWQGPSPYEEGTKENRDFHL